MSESRQVVCGHCGRTNRVPAEKPATDARCGSCHRPLFDGHPIEVDEQGFGRHLDRLLPGRDRVQEAGFAQRQRIYLNNVVNRNWQHAIIRLAVAAKCARC